MVEPATFPLPTELRNRLRAVGYNLHKGMGITVLRGLVPKRYSDEDNLIIHAGIASYIGVERVSNPHRMCAGKYSKRIAKLGNLTHQRAYP